MQVRIKPNRFAFLKNMRWRAGEVVEVEGNECPEWAVPVGGEEEKAVVVKLEEDRKAGKRRAFAPSSMVGQDANKITPIA